MNLRYAYMPTELVEVLQTQSELRSTCDKSIHCCSHLVCNISETGNSSFSNAAGKKFVNRYDNNDYYRCNNLNDQIECGNS